MQGMQKQIQYWKETGNRSLKTAGDLYTTRHYDACLFFCHLTLEKILKGLVVQHTKQPAPYLHDLAKLAALAAVEVTEADVQHLRTITTFNIAGRYDDIKLAFYKQCTPTFTRRYFALTKELMLCLVDQYHKK
jgi:HEPN domain-containing protein